jgi:hypothetical protein
MTFKSFFSIFNERYSKSKSHRNLWYHGTSSKYLKNILSNGLIVDAKEKSWDTDPDASSSTPDRTSYGGVYVTNNFTTASSAAWRVARRTEKDTMIVVMQLHPRGLVADEDSLVGRLKYFPDSVALFFYRVLTYGTPYQEYSDSVEKSKNEWVEKFLNQTEYELGELPRELRDRVISLLKEEGFLASVTRIVSYVTDNYMWQREWDSRKYKSEDIPPLPKPQEGEQVYRNFIDKLTKLLKIIPGKKETHSVGRSLVNIGYRGKNKIICILVIPERMKPDSDKTVYVAYGSVPDSVKEEIRQTFGEREYVYSANKFLVKT